MNYNEYDISEGDDGINPGCIIALLLAAVLAAGVWIFLLDSRVQALEDLHSEELRLELEHH